MVRVNVMSMCISQGEQMDRGVQASDYTVLISRGVCEVLNLTTASLVCMPPQAAPEKLPNSTSDDHPINVGRHRIHFLSKTLCYIELNINNEI